MKPATHTLVDLFGSDVRYVVPLYQRPYVWTLESHWRPLWEDIEDLLERRLDESHDDGSHFLGAVVLDQEETAPGEAIRRLVIDGQQRLTTLQLLIAAAADEASKAGCEKDERLLRRLTRNNEDLTTGDERFKVWPTNANQAAFRAVVGSADGHAGPDDPTNTIHEAHAYFCRAIRAWSRAESPDADEMAERIEALRVALSSLLFVVSINLESGDNAQVIFETLNARGTPLLAMDLVKNAVFYKASLAGLDTDTLHDNVWQPELGDTYWRQEKRQGRLHRPRAELFLMHWLAMRLGRAVPATELFGEFRSHVLDKTDPDAIESLIRELVEDARVLRSFDEQPAGSLEQRFFGHLETLDTTTVLPVALLLFRSVEVSKEQRRRGLLAIESWLVRRMVVGLTSKNYNKTVAELLAEARQDLPNAGDRIVAYLGAGSAAIDLWPSDQEIARVLLTRTMYGYVAQRRLVLVLSAIELERRRAAKTEAIPSLPPKLTIEHVMPQKWRENWPIPDDEDAAEVEMARDAALHRIGNLTLTSGPLNASMSNAPWPTKSQALKTHSLLLLNAELASTTSWDGDAISSRGLRLAREFCEIWRSSEWFANGKHPELPDLQTMVRDTERLPPEGGGGTRPRLFDLIGAGLLDDGETLYAKRKRVLATATVLGDGRLETEGEVFSTPSAAATRVAGTSENGWLFWLAERDGELVSLDDILKQLRSTPAG